MKRPWLFVLVLVSTLGAAPLELKVKVGDRVLALQLERYVAAVLAAESPGYRSDEALKAMAIAARTYAVRMRARHAAEGFDLCDTTHCQRADLSALRPRLEAAAAETAGEMLWYDGKPAFTPYTRDCGGKSEDAGAVWPDLAAPYLKSHVDTWCARGPHSQWQFAADARQVTGAMGSSSLRAPLHLDQITILDRTVSGRASNLMLSGRDGSVRVNASSFRFAIGRELGWNTIRSDLYAVHSANGHFLFEGSGSGHGVGLCQRGTEQMGLAGHSYREILAYYYPGTTLGLNGQGLRWQRLSSETITLLTLRPDSDRIALATAERLSKSLAARTSWPIPENIEIRVYPDVDTFRNATGEPGWIAARTDGRRIHLQPAALLRSRGALESTLSHELTHVMVESRAAPDLPLWFREGLADNLEKPRVSGVATIPPDADLRQRGDPARARSAYANADALVASLIKIYGETTVLRWVRGGLPLAVTKASASQAVRKSR